MAGWTEERRAACVQRILAHKPWLHSTGPRSAEGKARVSRNAIGRGRQQRLTAELAEIEVVMQAMAEAGPW